MRLLSADRLDCTESPYTVDGGYLQLEMSFLDYGFNSGDGSRMHRLSVAPANVKVGLTNIMDVQFVFEPYIQEHTEGDVNADGNGDLQILWKLNLWGNDSGQTAIGVMPFIKTPVASDNLGNQHVDGGVIFMMGFELPDEWGLGVMFEVDTPYD